MKKSLLLLVVIVLVFSFAFAGCNKVKTDSNQPAETAKATEKTDDKKETTKPEAKEDNLPDTWIADRHINVKVFMTCSEVLPDDQINNPIAQEIKKRTGITMTYDPIRTDDTTQEMTLYLASGDFHDAMMTGSVTSSSPVVNILLKAAREGMFADLAPFMKESEVYSRYFEKGFLARDAKDNIIFREEFGDAVYIIQLGAIVPEAPVQYLSTTYAYARKDIAEALGVDLSKIKTQDDLYNFAKKIKEGDFKDLNGETVIPMGAPIWGGRNEEYQLACYWPNYDFGNNGEYSNFDYDTDGSVKHVVYTDYVFKRLEYMRKLLAEGLLLKEAYTIDDPRATEAISNGSYAICKFHAFSQAWDDGASQYAQANPDQAYDLIGPMLNYKGEVEVNSRKAAGDLLLVPSTTENPEDIIKFSSFMATLEGQSLWKYGIEGEHYTVKEDGYYPTQEMMDALKDEPKSIMNLGFIGAGGVWGNIGGTNYNDVDNFGAFFYGGTINNDKFQIGFDLNDKVTAGGITFKDGYRPLGILTEWEGQETLAPVLKAYSDAFISACYADSMEEATKIIEAYRKQLKEAGVDDFCQYLHERNQEDPGSVLFYYSGY